MRTWRGRWVGWVNWGTQIADKAGYIWIYLELEYSLIEATFWLWFRSWEESEISTGQIQLVTVLDEGFEMGPFITTSPLDVTG